MVWCSKCKTDLPESSFSKSKKRSTGFQSLCKPCRKKYDAAKWQSLPIETRKDIWLKKRYGISLDQYDEMFQSQGESCAICGTQEPNGDGCFHVDHCHTTGKVRGILCQRCNHALGLLDDNIENLVSCINYLKKAS